MILLQSLCNSDIKRQDMVVSLANDTIKEMWGKGKMSKVKIQ
jgi:hypothetical protein